MMGIDNAHLFGLRWRSHSRSCQSLAFFSGIRTNFDPSIGPTRLIFAFEAVIIGGSGNLWGTLVGRNNSRCRPEPRGTDQSRLAGPGRSHGLPGHSHSSSARFVSKVR